MKKLLLLTTCGTSVLTKQADGELKEWLIDMSNATKLEPEGQAKLDAHVKQCRDKICAASEEERCRLSAELNAISKILARDKPDVIQHVLLHTDTAVGRAAYKIIAEILHVNGTNVQPLTADGLRTDDIESFRNSLAALTSQLDDWVKYQNDGYKVLFNLTGGFKSLSSYLQAYGSLKADECVFLFERSPMLMEIPRLPLTFSPREAFEAHLAVFRRLAAGYDVSAQEAEGISETLLMSDGQTVLWSVWSDILWPDAQKELYAERLFEPLTDKISFSNRKQAEKEFAAFAPADRVATNVALDALACHLDTGKPLMKSHTLKPLVGKPRPPATHELYVTSDTARRIYGRLSDGHFIIDAIGEHL